MNIAVSTSEAGESLIYDLPDLNDFDGIISMPATMGNDIAVRKHIGSIDVGRCFRDGAFRSRGGA